jgi:hypothetical protein
LLIFRFYCYLYLFRASLILKLFRGIEQSGLSYEPPLLILQILYYHVYV